MADGTRRLTYEVLRKGKPDMLVIIRGRGAAVVQDTNANQLQLDIAAQAVAEEGIRQGLEDAKIGKTRSAKEFFDEFEANHGIPC